MFKYRNLSLCNNDNDRCISFKSHITRKVIEPAGIVFFLTREWSLRISFENVYEVSNLEPLEKGLLEPIKDYYDYVKKFENDLSFLHELKYKWMNCILSSVNITRIETVEDSVNNDEDDKKNAKKKLQGTKSLGFVRNFISQNKNAYELLNCSDSDDISKIKSNYKKIVLLLHPDKSENLKIPEELQNYNNKFNITGLNDEDKKRMFLSLQDAFNILSDPVLRHEYDCNLPFDEWIPTSEDVKVMEDFFMLFEPVFSMNSRWSRKKPVPSLGTMETAYEEVDDFYEFWRNFETDRTFSHAAPYLLEEAECREEKRWMERENLKVQKKLVKKELIRIQKLVDIAEANDPRLKARSARIKMEKLNKQKELEELKLLQQRELELEEQKKEQEKILLLEKTKYEKQIVKKLRQHIRSIGNRVPEGVKLSENFDKLSALEYEFVRVSCEKIYKLLGYDRAILSDEESLKFVKQMDSIVKSSELNNIQEFVIIIKLISDQLSPTDNKRPTPVKTVQLANTENTQEDDQWTPLELSNLSKAIEIHTAGVPGRWNLIAKHVKTKSMGQCIKMAKEISAGKIIETEGNSTLWTEQQQASFEMALEKYPVTLGSSLRWKMIASEVEGKTVKDCINRFKMIKAAISASTPK